MITGLVLKAVLWAASSFFGKQLSQFAAGAITACIIGVAVIGGGSWALYAAYSRGVDQTDGHRCAACKRCEAGDDRGADSQNINDPEIEDASPRGVALARVQPEVGSERTAPRTARRGRRIARRRSRIRGASHPKTGAVRCGK